MVCKNFENDTVFLIRIHTKHHAMFTKKYTIIIMQYLENVIW